MASHLERGTAFRRATMWTMKQIMESGAMGVQITISGKLRGDRSAFEKHVAGILPRAGHHAEVIVDEDIAHVETCLLYTSPSPRDRTRSRMPSSA